MRKTLLLLALLGLSMASFSQPAIRVTEAPASVGLYDKYEVTFTMNSYDNPYDPNVIDAYALFTSPDGRTLRANGFYYEGYSFKENKGVEVATRQREKDCWKVRFTPDMPGRWTFMVQAIDQNGGATSASMAFDCRAKANANGFVRVANSQYLKREVVAEGEAGYHSFFPIGPNVAWYESADYYRFKKPYGIYEYKYYIDALSGNANYMRVWACRYQYLSLYGPEHAIRDNDVPTMYFDSKLNQKDAAELDFIVSYAAEHGINLMLCLFTYDDFRDDSEALASSQQYGCMPSGWRYNPYHTVLGLERPAEFFSNPKAIRVTQNLLRYYVARWGYATNLVCWELFNEVANIFKKTTMQGDELDAVVAWHNDMADMVRSMDPHRHLVTSSIGGASEMADLKYHLYDNLDFVQDHNYQNIQKAKSKEQMSYILLKKSNEMLERYPNKPCFMGEYALTNEDASITNSLKDPKGVDLHNSLWSSLFSGSMGSASFWFWRDLKQCNLFERFKPILVFSNNLPILSDTFKPDITGQEKGRDLVFPNSIATYYIYNADKDTLIGWCQDTAFCYQALRRLSDEVGPNYHFILEKVFDPEGYVYTLNPEKRPRPSGRSSRIAIPMENQRAGTRYLVQWFDPETGRELRSETAEVIVRRSLFHGKRIVIDFPASLRNTFESRVNNTFGDAVFIITKK